MGGIHTLKRVSICFKLFIEIPGKPGDCRKWSSVKIVKELRPAPKRTDTPLLVLPVDFRFTLNSLQCTAKGELWLMSFSLWGKKFLKPPDISFALTAAVLGTQVYGDHQDEMGIVGYFPSNLVKEQQVYQEAIKEVPTTVSISEGVGGWLRSWGNVDLF